MKNHNPPNRQEDSQQRTTFDISLLTTFAGSLDVVQEDQTSLGGAIQQDQWDKQS